jgi:hypothetical protein
MPTWSGRSNRCSITFARDWARRTTSFLFLKALAEALSDAEAMPHLDESPQVARRGGCHIRLIEESRLRFWEQERVMVVVVGGAGIAIANRAIDRAVEASKFMAIDAGSRAIT